MGYNLIPHEILNCPGYLRSGPRSRFLLLTAWALPERRFGGLFTLSLKRLAYYTSMTTDSLAEDIPKVDPGMLRWDPETELLWLPPATSGDCRRLNEKQAKGLAANLLQAPWCPLRDDVQAAMLVASPVATRPLLNALFGGLPIPLSQPLSNGSVCVDVCVDVDPEGAAAAAERRGERPPMAGAAIESTEEVVAYWNQVFAGTRLALDPASTAGAARMALCSRHLDAAQQIVQAVRRSTYLRTEARFCSFVWAFTPANADKLMAGGWPADSCIVVPAAAPPPPPAPDPVDAPTPEEINRVLADARARLRSNA